MRVSPSALMQAQCEHAHNGEPAEPDTTYQSASIICRCIKGELVFNGQNSYF